MKSHRLIVSSLPQKLVAFMILILAPIGTSLTGAEVSFIHFKRNGTETGPVQGKVIEAVLNSQSNNNRVADLKLKLDADIYKVAGGSVKMMLEGDKSYSTSDIDYDEGRVVLTYQNISRDGLDKVIAALNPKFNKREKPEHRFTSTYTLETKEPNAGDAVLVKIQIKNVGDKPLTFRLEGKIKGSDVVVRDDRFKFKATTSIGHLPLNNTVYQKMGSLLSGLKTLAPGQTHEETADLTQWFDFKEGETYNIVGTFPLAIYNEAGNKEWDYHATGSLRLSFPSP